MSYWTGSRREKLAIVVATNEATGSSSSSYGKTRKSLSVANLVRVPIWGASPNYLLFSTTKV
jgi:hypothetical protein